MSTEVNHSMSMSIAQEYKITPELSIAIVNAYSPHMASVTEAYESLLRQTAKDPDDKESYAEAKKAQRAAASIRVKLDNERKSLKENILKMGKAVDSVYKQIIEPIVSQETRIKKEIENTDAILEDRKTLIKRELALPVRKEKLQSMSVLIPADDILLQMDDDAFNAYIQSELVKAAEKAEMEAKKAREEKKRIEEELLKEMEIEERAKKKAEELFRASESSKAEIVRENPSGQPAKTMDTNIEGNLEPGTSQENANVEAMKAKFNAYIQRLLAQDPGEYPESSAEYHKAKAIREYIERFKE